MTAFFTRLFDFERPDSSGQVLYFRVLELVIGYWVVLFAWTWGFYMQRITGVVLPLGIAGYVDVTFLFDNYLSLVNAAAITLAFLGGLARLWRGGYLTALLLLHLQYAGRYSLGEISHGSNVIGMALLALGLGALLFEDRLQFRRFTLGFTYFFLGLGYTSAAVCKLIASGIMWVDGAHMWMWIAERAVDTLSMTGDSSVNFLQVLLLESRPLASAVLAFGLVTEFFGFLIWFRRPRTVVMLLLVAMHVGIFLSMKINFPANNALLLALALPWDRIIDRTMSRMPAISRLASSGRLGRA